MASRKGSGRHWRKASRALLLSLRLQIVRKYSQTQGVVQPLIICGLKLTEGNSAQRASEALRSAAPRAG